jgi:predicted Zn-dependent protease
VKNTSNALIFLQISTAAAGVGYVGDIAQLVAMGSIFSFSRDEEREADDIGFELMKQAGYDTREAAKVWEALIAERKASEAPTQFIFFSTHPATEERVKTLKNLANELNSDGKDGIIGKEKYLAAIRPFRAAWLRSELQKDDFKATKAVFDRLFKTGDNLAELNFFQGELCRLRCQKGDNELAIKAYQKSQSEGSPPPELFRSLGLVYWRNGQKKEACASFKKYLQIKPDAHDKQIINSYIEQLR